MILSNGVYLSDNDLCPKEDPTVLAAVIRSRRNRLLEESDKYMLTDYPISEEERAAWDQEGFPFNTVFPEVETK